MRISGSFKELKYLIDRTFNTNATALVLTPKGEAWMLFSEPGYIYIKTQLSVSKSLLFGGVDLKNMRSFLNSSTRNKNKESTGLRVKERETIEITESYVMYDDDQNNKSVISLGYESGELADELADKMESRLISHVQLDKPYMRLKPELLRLYRSGVDAYGRELTTSFQRRTKFRLDSDESENRISLKGFEIAFNKEYNDGQVNKEFLYDEGYFVPRFFKTMNVNLSDADLSFMTSYSARYETEDFFIIPLENHYVIEVHNEEMILKMMLPRKESIELSDVL